MHNPFDNDEGRAAISRRLKPPADSATVQDYVDDVWAAALDIAPCIGEDTFDVAKKGARVKGIIRGIILRWHESQSGAATGRTQSAGPYQQSLQLDARPKRGYQLQPSEVVDLQRLCLKRGRPFSFDTMPDDFKDFNPLSGAVVNGDDDFNGPPGEWSPDAPKVDV